MKILYIILSSLLLTSAWAIDDGTYILKNSDLKNQYLLTEGYQIMNGRFRSLDVMLGSKGILSANFRGPTLNSQATFMQNSEYGMKSKRTGLLTSYCKTQYGLAYAEGEALVIRRWDLEREASFGCPFSKRQSQRGLKNGKKNESTLIFHQKDNSVFVRFGMGEKPQKLIRIR